jgi:hypothetical protein
MSCTHWEVRHNRHSLTITRETFAAARSEFCRQWRDPDGSIPWTIWMVETDYRLGPVVSEYRVDPWTGVVA